MLCLELVYGCSLKLSLQGTREFQKWRSWVRSNQLRFPARRLILVIPESRTDSSQYKSETRSFDERFHFRIKKLDQCSNSSRKSNVYIFFFFFFFSFSRFVDRQRIIDTKYSLLNKRVVDGKRFIVSTVSRNKLRFR